MEDMNLVCEWSEEAIYPGDDYIEYDDKPYKDTSAMAMYLLHKEMTKEELVEWIEDNFLDDFVKFAESVCDYKHWHLNTDEENKVAYYEEFEDERRMTWQ